MKTETQSKLTLFALAGVGISALLGTAAPTFAAGSATSGGGHGVERSNGGITFLDLLEEPENFAKQEINLFQNPMTTEAAQRASEFIGFIAQSHPEFGAALSVRLQEMKWALSSVPLKPIDDANLDTPQDLLVQVARQDGNAHVLIDQNLLSRMDTDSRGALIIHELMLAKLGRNFPRKTLRLIISRYFRDGASGLPAIQAAFDGIHPSILQGRYAVLVQFRPDPRSHGILGTSSTVFRAKLGDMTTHATDPGYMLFDSQNNYAPDNQGNVVRVKYSWHGMGSDVLPGTLRFYVNGILMSAERIVIKRKGGYGEFNRGWVLH